MKSDDTKVLDEALISEKICMALLCRKTKSKSDSKGSALLARCECIG